MHQKLGLLVAFVCIMAFITAVDCKSDGPGQWQILTKLNFSSTIRLHPHILLLVTVPWSGESRSLMKEISTLVTNRQEEFNALKLMVMYKNTEKMLADAIGATTKETAILYYHHSVSYKYQGRLTSKYILSSIYPYMSVAPEELPLKRLSNAEDLKAFLDSTDVALLLFEFCGWAPKLLAKAKKNGTENGGLLGTSFRGETPIAMAKSFQKVAGMDNAEMKCGIDHGFDAVPWLSFFASVNESATFEETENLKPGGVSSCTFEDYQRFDSFSSKFMTIAKDFFLPSERHRAGLVSDRSILSILGIQDSGSWLAVLYFAGCPSCLRILNKEDDLNNVLKMDNPIVLELETDDHDLASTLPANKPSILLFVDRSSDFETRRKGKEALDALRELALRYHNPYPMSKFQTFKSSSGRPRIKLSSASQMVKLKDKMSTVVILNEGKHVTLEKVTSGLQGNSLHEVLAHFLKQKKEVKLSSLAKELGFQLLSDDIDVKLVNTLSSQTEIQSEQVSQKPSKEDYVASDVDLDKQMASMSAEEHPITSKVNGAELYSQYDDEKTKYVGSSEQLISVESKQFVTEQEDVKVETNSQQIDTSRDQRHHFHGSKFSFFFCDGNYRLLQTLTGLSKIPSLVIVDPIQQQHYVFPKEKHLNYSSLDVFLTGFLNESLVPYQQSESVHQSPREAIQPPFVNLDFHEVDSLPRVTSNTFSRLVLGFNQSGTSAWSKDVLVLFSNRWCGFCQRMELVVREVYRAVKGYVNMLRSESSNGKTTSDEDKLKDVSLKFPLIYLLDCTLNDCSLILKSINEREVYPSLILFPAERKNALLYDGHMSVTDVIRFIADHGSDSHHLTHDDGIIWSIGKKEDESQNLYRKIETCNKIEEHTLKGMHEAALQVVTGNILIATKKLLHAKPFDKSKILIVKADQNGGFEGLIFNKNIRWDAFDKLEEGLEILREAPLSFGGPVIKYGMPLLALTKRAVRDQYPEILPGIFFLDQSATIHEIKELKSGTRSITDYWFFLGYSSWGWEQMFDEIAEGSWDVSDDSLTHLGWP